MSLPRWKRQHMPVTCIARCRVPIYLVECGFIEHVTWDRHLNSLLGGLQLW
jgi:hypothetical protein